MFKAIYQRVKREIRVYRLALEDPRTPRAAKWILRVALAYLLSPLDLIPDAIPILGLIDDLIIVPAVLVIVHGMIPAEVWADCRRKARQSP